MIRNAKFEDLSMILKIYDHARTFMAESGNPTQWGSNFPKKELLMEDIQKKQLYVYEEFGVIHGVFAFIIGEDATYQNIQEGRWISDTVYGTIHRVAGDGQVKGVFKQVVDYCESRISHVRIDTHENNRIMQHLIEKSGFTRCGIIYVADGSPRIAYEKLCT